MKYHEINSALYIILKSSVLYLLSFIILHTSIWGTTRKLYIDLYNYFTRQKAEFIDYTISDEGITLVLAKTSTMYNWDSINFVESDSNYYYFTCNGKCSLIDKNDMTLDIQNIFESIIFENNVLFYNLY